MELWHTLGMERHGLANIPTRSYFAASASGQRCLGVILVYSTHNPETLNQLSEWIKKARDGCDVREERVVFSLWGNRRSTSSSDAVQGETVDAFVQRYDLRRSLVFSVNTETGEGIRSSLERLVAALLEVNSRSTNEGPLPRSDTGASVRLDAVCTVESRTGEAGARSRTRCCG